MKAFKLILLACIAYAGFILFTSPISACNKKQVITDTVIVKDTITKTVTDTVRDTVGCCNINDGMVAYYTFTNGSLKDSSGMGNDISFSNATKTTDRFGIANGAYLFDGSSSYMTVANSASLNPANITIMVIIKINGYYAGQCHENQILGKGYPDYTLGWYAMRIADTADCYQPPYTNGEAFSGVHGDDNPMGVAPAAGPRYDSVHAQTGQWYNLVYTFDGTVSNYYINGVLKDSKVKTGTWTPNSNRLFIGKHEDPSFPYSFNGVIDEIRIYNKALCATAVKQLNSLGAH